MTQTRLAVVLVATLGAVSVVEPCTCVPLPPGATHTTPFLTVVRDAELIVLADVVDHIGKRHTKRKIHEAMRVTVVEVLKGAEKRQTLVVRGDTGALCRPYVSRFPPGTRWVLALMPADENRGQYAISSCGEYWLPVVGPKVRGYIHSTPQQRNPEIEIDLDELRALLKQRS
jgi:hypothetical protein